ncbi:MAG TPA: hypothetical protein VFZ24_10515 [Longimicrobiales bacterium]
MDVVIPGHIGPPPHVRVRIPAHAGPPTFLSSIVAVGTGFDFSCALRGDGVAFCWGENLRGQLGDGTTIASAVPVQVSTTIPFRQLFVGDQIACGLDANDNAHCWGANLVGELGAGIAEGTPSLVPAPVAAPHQFTSLSLGLRASCGMGVDGLAYCWGQNANGDLGVGSAAPTINVPMPILNSATVGLHAVNTSGLGPSCGLGTGNQVYCWGLDAGRFGNGTTANLRSAAPVPAANGMTFSSVHVSFGYTCGLTAAGEAYCWGTRNTFGEMGIGSTAAPVLLPTPAAAGLVFASLDEDDTNRSFKTTCGVTTSGEGWCWGANIYGQLGAPSNEICTPNPSFNACSTSPVQISGGIGFSRIAVGGDHACGVAVDGAVYCWGRNHVGQLGDGTLTDRAAPVPVLLN